MIRLRARLACSVMLCFALTIPMLAKDQVGRPVGGGSSISWSVDVRGHEMIELTVITPDGDSYRQEFKAGRDPAFNLRELESVENGVYSYELRVVPKVSADVKRKLVEARAKNDEKAAKKIRKEAGLLQTVVQSGAFTVSNGAIVAPDLTEGPASSSFGVETTGSTSQPGGGRRSFQPVVNDTVIPDDLIVQGSGCFGFDCVDGESFGFDTIRLKENNLRIKAEDTSVGTYPTNDWQLTFNDSASGGANKFSVEDVTGAKVPFTITAGAATNSMFIDSTGRVGFRTSTPVLDLHVATSNTPALRLEQNNSGGFTAQTWDVAGNEANFFVRDVTGGSRLPFRIRPGAPTSSIDISASGNVGIGTASPTHKLHIVGDVASDGLARVQNTNATGFSGFVYYDNAGAARTFIGTDNAASQTRVASFGTSPMVLVTNNVERVRIDSTGRVGIGITAPLSKLHVDAGDIRVSNGSFIDDGTTLNVPDYVFGDSYALMPIEELGKFIQREKHLPNIPSASTVKSQGLNLSKFQMQLLEKVEELTLYTLNQHAEISSLKANNDALLERLAAIEAKLASKQ
jgi:hypothetical protein